MKRNYERKENVTKKLSEIDEKTGNDGPTASEMKTTTSSSMSEKNLRWRDA